MESVSIEIHSDQRTDSWLPSAAPLPSRKPKATNAVGGSSQELPNWPNYQCLLIQKPLSVGEASRVFFWGCTILAVRQDAKFKSSARTQHVLKSKRLGRASSSLISSTT